jgi:predicted nucleotidyltransferase
MIDPKEIPSALKKELQNNTSVAAILLVGSYSRETIYKADKHSDMEVYLVVKDEKVNEVKDNLPDLVKSFGKVLFYFNHAIGFVVIYENLFRLELPIVKESDLKSVFSRPKQQTVKVLLDKTAGRLEKILQKREETMDYEKYFKDKVDNFWYNQIIAVQYYAKGEYFNSRVALGMNSSILVKFFELLNDPDILLLEINKRIEKFLTQEQIGKLKVVSSSYDASNIKESLIRIMDIIPEITEKVKVKYGYFYDESLKTKLKSRLLRLLV